MQVLPIHGDASAPPVLRRHISICFIHTPCAQLRDDRLEPPLGLLYLATIAQAAGYRVDVTDLSAYALEGLNQLIPDGFDVYGFSTYSVNYGLTCELMAAVRQRNLSALLMAGGPHATALPAAVAADGFDVVVTGEGEVAVLNILGALALGESPPRVVARHCRRMHAIANRCKNMQEHPRWEAYSSPATWR